MAAWRAHTRWRALRCNVLRVSGLLEYCLSARVQQNLGRSRGWSYWGCVLNRTSVPPVVREVCQVTVRHSWSAASVGTARLSLVLRVLAVPVGISAYSYLVGVAPLTRAHCRRRVVPSRLPPPCRSHDPELQFDWSKFWDFLAPDLVLLVLAIASAVLAAILNISIPLEVGRLVNTVSGLSPGEEVRDYLQRLMPSGVRLAGMYLTQSVFTFFYITLLSLMGERLAVRLRTALFRSLVEQDIVFFDRHKSGELISRLSGDIQDFKSSFKMVVSQGLRSVTQTLGCVVSLYLISPQMTVVVGVALPVMIAVGTTFGAVLRQWSRQAQEQVAIATGVANEALSNVRTVRAFAMEEKETSLFSQELQKACWLNERLGTGIAFFQALSNLAINGIVLAVVSHGGLLLVTNQISAGDLMSFLVATQTIQRSMGNLSILFGQVVRGTSAGARVFEYMALHPSIPLRGGATIPLNQIEGRVEFKNVKFTYPTRPEQAVLEDLTLELPPGKVTALCGLSGAGKSTVAALLERFYDPQHGAILLDGHPLSSLDPSWVRGELAGYIHQEPVLFATSVMENIRYGRPSATDQEVYEASRLANADGFICQFPDGYSTMVGERGHSVSGGQKQRIAIARALLKNPRVLILDEATSALDAQSERLVQEALDRACRGRTVLVIAHRLSTIQGADQIAVLHHGKLRELGTHAALLAKGGIYAELIRRQTVVP